MLYCWTATRLLGTGCHTEKEQVMSDDAFVMTPGQVAHLDKAFVGAEYTPADVHKLCNGRKAYAVRRYLRGECAMAATNIIDCDADFEKLCIGDVFKVVENRRDGLWRFNPQEVVLCTPRSTKRGITGEEFRAELIDRCPLNAATLEHFFLCPQIIPHEWRAGPDGEPLDIAFFGTVETRWETQQVVRTMSFEGDRWCIGFLKLEEKVPRNTVAALRIRV